MDDFEKIVLKKRKVMIEEHVKVDSDVLSGMKRNGVIDDDMITIIMSEKANTKKLARLFEFMRVSTVLNTFDSFCNAFMMVNPDISWLAKELQAEVKADKGNLQIDEDVNREAATIVHRQFGTSKRFGEADKKEVQSLIAVKIQVSKEDFKMELDQIKREVREKDARYKARDEQALAIRDMLLHFIKDNESRLTSAAHGMKTTTDILRNSIADDDLMGKMEEAMRHLLRQVLRVISEQDLLYEDKEKCMKILGIKDDTSMLHAVLKHKMTDLPFQIERAKSDLRDKDDNIARLRKLLSEAEKEIHANEEQIKALETELELLRETLAISKDKMKELAEDSRTVEEAPAQERVRRGSANVNGKQKKSTRPK